MTKLSAENLSFSYGSRPVLKGLEFDPLPSGKLTALIGPNAAGKSTLFRLISGLAKPAAGHVILNDTNLASLGGRERLKRICFMPQYFAANAALTVFDVVMMAHKQLRGWRVTAADMAAVAQALAEAGIGVDVKCADGICGVCKCDLLSGEVEHRDFVLSKAQRKGAVILCQSRAAQKDGTIEVDL